MPHIRIHNATGADLETVVMYVPTESREAVEFGALCNDAYSVYQSVPTAYRIAEIDVSGATGSYSLRPYDYVGERPLSEGRYTYRLGIAQGRLTIDLDTAEN